MQGLPTGLPIAYFANAEESESAQLLGLANELTIEADGWAIIPFGDSAHSGRDGRMLANAAEKPQPVIQRFDRAAAEAVVGDFKSTWSRIKRAVVGLPIFKGHPDAPRFAARFPDRMPRGTIADMEVRDRGLAIKPVLTGEGAAEVEAGWSAFSPYWPSRLVGEENGTRIFSTFKLISIGLLPPGRENIAGLSLANAVEPDSDPASVTMKDKLKKFLQSIGVSTPDQADETALANGLDSASTAIESLKTDKAAAETKLVTLTAQLSTLGAERDTAVALANAKAGEITILANAKETAETALKAERTARAKLVVLDAVKTGRVVAAELEAETLALANAADFAAAATALETRAPKLHTQSALGRLAAEGNNGKSRTEQVIHLVNERMESDPAIKSLPLSQRYDAAFSAVEADPQNAALFAAMQKPGTAA